MVTRRYAPELDLSGWLQGGPVTLADLRGRVVMLETFQMLCPGCVAYGLPLAQRVHQSFRSSDVTVIGLHTVFEHHDVMGRDALAAFVSEYRFDFPIGIDRHVAGPIPATMQHYELRGTPSTVLIDRNGRIAHAYFGSVDELMLGVEIGRLLSDDPDPDGSPAHPGHTDAPACRPDGICT